MQYASIPSILEDDDIAAVERISSGTTAADGPLGELPAYTLPDGRTALPVLLILHAPSERDQAKTYGGAGDPLPFPLSFHLTNGVEHQTVPILPAGTHPAPQAEPQAAAAAAEAVAPAEPPARSRRRSAAAPEPEPESEAATEQEVPVASGELSAEVDSEQAGETPPPEQVSDIETEAGAEPA